MVQNAEHEKHAEGQTEVDEALDVFGEQEHVLRHVDLGKNGRIAHEGSHALVRGLTEKREHQVATEQIGRVVRGIAPKKLRENQPHDQQGQQRRQHAPGHAEARACICF